jgi:uncharacterized protein (DUF362 family)
MADFTDKVIGLYHFITDRTPKNVPSVEAKPRKANPWRRNGQVLVAKVLVETEVRLAVDRAITLLGDLGHIVSRGDRVLVKPNFNSPDPYPGSTDLTFLHAVVELFLELGARVAVGESAGGIWRPTKKVFQKLGLDELTHRFGIELIIFEDRPDDWVKVKVGGDYLKTITIPRSAYEADRIVYLPCMKTHNLAGFSGALKLTVGFMHPGERRALHARHLLSKIAEISLAWQPDLIVMDGRKAFVSGGPDRGQLAEPRLVLASGDLVAIDIEAMKVILTYQARNKLTPDPWQSPQIVQALKHNLGARQGDYVVVE